MTLAIQNIKYITVEKWGINMGETDDCDPRHHEFDFVRIKGDSRGERMLVYCTCRICGMQTALNGTIGLY